MTFHGVTMSITKTIMHKTQGPSARLLDKMPARLQEQLARRLGYHYQFDGLNPFYKCLLATQHLQNKHHFIEPNYEKSRKVFQAQMKSLVAQPTTIKAVKDIQLPLSQGITHARHYHPQPKKALPLVVFYHGGGWVVGDLNTHDEACRLLAKYGNVQVLSIDYPLAPEHSPAQIVHVCVEALEWTYQHRKELNILNDRIAVAGDSAGGNLSAVVSQKTQYTIYAPSAQLLFYPALDFNQRYPSFEKFKAGVVLTEQDIDTVSALYPEKCQMDKKDPLISPIYGELKQVAPAFIITSGFDVLHDEGLIYADKLKAAGIVVHYTEAQDQPHGFINFTTIHKGAKQHLINTAKAFRKFWDQQK